MDQTDPRPKSETEARQLEPSAAKKNHHPALRRLLYTGLSVFATVVIVPALLNQSQKLCACKNPASEGRTVVSAMGRSQQAYLLEHDSFSRSLSSLNLGVPEETDHYAYSIELSEGAAFHFARSRSTEFSSFVAGVFAGEDSVEVSEASVSAELIVCESNQPDQPIEPPPNAETCAPGSTRIR